MLDKSPMVIKLPSYYHSYKTVDSLCDVSKSFESLPLHQKTLIPKSKNKLACQMMRNYDEPI